jgi:hypothetical protein
VLLVARLVRVVQLDSPVAASADALGLPEFLRSFFLQVLLDVLVRAAQVRLLELVLWTIFLVFVWTIFLVRLVSL